MSNVITLYDRFRDGIRVTATQEPLSAEAILAIEAKLTAEAGVVGEDGVVAKRGNVSRNEYIVRGYVNGELVKEEIVDGYRSTSPAARGMFKALHTKFAAPKVPQVVKEPKVMTTDPAELKKLADKAEATAARAVARAAKLKELTAEAEAAIAIEAPVEAQPPSYEAQPPSYEAQ